MVGVERVEISARVVVRDEPLTLAAAQIGSHQIAYGKIQNILTGDEQPKPEYLILNLLGEEGTLKRASILVPSTPTTDSRVLHMRIPDQ